MSDARFEDGAARPLRLKAETAEDLEILSSLAQDAVFPGHEMTWQRGKRRFAILINRFRWEDNVKQPERAQAVLAFDDVSAVASQGVARDSETVFSLLQIGWEPGPDGTGQIRLTLAGDGAIRLSAECLNATLQDVTQAYRAPSGKTPRHPE